MWVVPTISRPEQCFEMLGRLKEKGCSTKGVVFVNWPGEGYEDLDEHMPNGDWYWYRHSENIGAIGALNYIFRKHPGEEFYGFLGDDEFVETGGWDVELVEKAGAWGVSHGKDNLYQGRRAQAGLCIGGELARAVGYLAVKECWHWFGLDDMWESLSSVLHNRTVCDVVFEHRHFLKGLAVKDECYSLGEKKREQDKLAFLEWRRSGEMTEAIRRVVKAGGLER